MDFTTHSSAGGNHEIGSAKYSLVIIALSFDQCLLPVLHSTLRLCSGMHCMLTFHLQSFYQSVLTGKTGIVPSVGLRVSTSRGGLSLCFV